MEYFLLSSSTNRDKEIENVIFDYFSSTPNTAAFNKYLPKYFIDLYPLELFWLIFLLLKQTFFFKKPQNSRSQHKQILFVHIYSFFFKTSNLIKISLLRTFDYNFIVQFTIQYMNNFTTLSLFQKISIFYKKSSHAILY